MLRYDLTTDGEVWTAVFEDNRTVIVPRGWDDNPVALDQALRAVHGGDWSVPHYDPFDWANEEPWASEES